MYLNYKNILNVVMHEKNRLLYYALHQMYRADCYT